MLKPILCTLALILGLEPALAEERPKNIIVMIADGAGYNMLAATRLWRGGPLAVDRPGFLQMAQSTYPLRTGNEPVDGPEGLRQDAEATYTSARAWNTRAVAGNSRVPRFTDFPAGFEGYEWARATYPDSANTATAMATGVKTYNNAINVDGRGQPVLSLAEVAKASGKATGVVTTVQLGDATPAAFGGAHSISRSRRSEIVFEMFSSGTLDVIAGTGNPDFDDDGKPRAPSYRWFTESMWTDLKGGTNASGVQGKGPAWSLLTRRAGIQAVASGRTRPPARLAMVIEADEGHQAYRACEGCDRATMAPYARPQLAGSPTLTELSLAAFARLGGAEQGFYLMIEGGAVDRAMHANFLGRAIEEYDEFDRAVNAVIDWIDRPDTPADWSNTLLIVTADHDHHLHGPDGDRIPFAGLVDRGAGQLPGHRWFATTHSNFLVPLFVRGAGAERIAAAADAQDVHRDREARTFGRGRMTDQADLGKLLLELAR